MRCSLRLWLCLLTFPHISRAWKGSNMSETCKETVDLLALWDKAQALCEKRGLEPLMDLCWHTRNPMGNLEFCKYKLLFYGVWACLGFFQATKTYELVVSFQCASTFPWETRKADFHVSGGCEPIEMPPQKGSWRTIGSLPSHTDSRPRFYWWVQNQTA